MEVQLKQTQTLWIQRNVEVVQSIWLKRSDVLDKALYDSDE